MMAMVNRLALMLVLAGALMFGLSGGSKDSVSGNPEALWDRGVREAHAMVSEETQEKLSDRLMDSVQVAGEVTKGVENLTAP
jgi:hypothetical protein